MYALKALLLMRNAWASSDGRGGLGFRKDEERMERGGLDRSRLALGWRSTVEAWLDKGQLKQGGHRWTAFDSNTLEKQ